MYAPCPVYSDYTEPPLSKGIATRMNQYAYEGRRSLLSLFTHFIPAAHVSASDGQLGPVACFQLSGCMNSSVLYPINQKAPIGLPEKPGFAVGFNIVHIIWVSPMPLTHFSFFLIAQVNEVMWSDPCSVREECEDIEWHGCFYSMVAIGDPSDLHTALKMNRFIFTAFAHLVFPGSRLERFARSDEHNYARYLHGAIIGSASLSSPIG